jgi:hypothetical protein
LRQPMDIRWSPARFVWPWKRSKSATERFSGIAISFSTVRDPRSDQRPCGAAAASQESLGFARSKAGSTLARGQFSFRYRKPRKFKERCSTRLKTSFSTTWSAGCLSSCVIFLSPSPKQMVRSLGYGRSYTWDGQNPSSLPFRCWH